MHCFLSYIICKLYAGNERIKKVNRHIFFIIIICNSMYYNMDEIYYSRIFNEAYKNIKKNMKKYIFISRYVLGST